MSEELKTCPFCGGEATLCENLDYAYVYCRDCGCQTDESHVSAKEAIAAWNQRAERTCKAIPGRMKYGTRVPMCSECGYSIGDRRYNYCPNCGARVERDDV